MASKYDFVDGRVVRLVAEDVQDQETHAATLQADLDEKQNAVNVAVQEQANVEVELADLESQAEAKANQLESVKTARESAESELAKSLDSRNSFVAAVELANSQSVTPEVDGDSENAEGGSAHLTGDQIAYDPTPAEG